MFLYPIFFIHVNLGGSSGGSYSGGGSSYSGGGGYASGGGAAIVQKHIYVHVPPPEPEEQHVQRPIPVAQAQKHYKIIFIKAPSAPSYQAPIIPVQPQNEEKTLVYVLVKKPEEQQDIVIPTAAPTQPSKPEVRFAFSYLKNHLNSISLFLGILHQIQDTKGSCFRRSWWWWW